MHNDGGMREQHPKAALHELFHKMHYPLPWYQTEDMIQVVINMPCAERAEFSPRKTLASFT